LQTTEPNIKYPLAFFIHFLDVFKDFKKFIKNFIGNLIDLGEILIVLTGVNLPIDFKVEIFIFFMRQSMLKS